MLPMLSLVCFLNVRLALKPVLDVVAKDIVEP